MKREQSKSILRWNKQMICEMLNVDIKDLNYCISEETKTTVEWKGGKQLFNDKQVFTIIKDFRRLATDEEIQKLIYPFGLF